MKRILPVLLVLSLVCMLAIGTAAAVEPDPDPVTGKEAAAYVSDGQGAYVPEYYDTLEEAIAASQGNNYSGRIFIFTDCDFSGDIVISKPTVLEFKNRAPRASGTFTGTLTLNAPLTIESGVKFTFNVPDGEDVAITINEGGALTVANMQFVLNGSGGIGIKNTASTAAEVLFTWATCNVTNCSAALDGDMTLMLSVYSNLSMMGGNTLHESGALKIDVTSYSGVSVMNCTGNGIVADSIVLDFRSSAMARNCGGSGIIAGSIEATDGSDVTVTNNGRTQAQVLYMLRRAASDNGYGLVADSLTLTDSELISENNKLNGALLGELEANAGSTIILSGNGNSGSEAGAMHITGAAVIEDGADIQIKNNAGSAIGVASGASLRLTGAVFEGNTGGDIVNNGTIEVSGELAENVSIKGSGRVNYIGEAPKGVSASAAPMLLMRIGFAKITVLDADGAPAADAAYDLYTARGRKLRTCQTDENGVIATRSLTGGTYYLVPAGEALDTESAWSFEIVGFGKCEAFTMTTESEQ